MACVAVNSLVRTLELEFLQARPRQIFQEYQIIPSNRDLIQSLHQKLQFLIDLFDESRIDCDEAIKDLETLLRDVAFQAEDEIELLVADIYKEKKKGKSYKEGMVDPKKELHCILQKAIEDIDAIKEAYKQARAALQRRKTTPDAFPKFDDDKVITKRDSDSQSKDKMVGKNDEFEEVMKIVIHHPSKQLEVVSIEGMGGIGKTTLARRVYNDSSVASYFDKRAWVVASQNHDEKKMFIDLLKSMDEAVNVSNENLVIRQCLKGQRYLIVMDDVWSTEAWDVVKGCFPNDENGSRVLLTTRLAKVTSYTRSSNDFSHQMQLLNPSESWNLFNENAKAYRYGEAKLERILKPIVEKCRGLPLAITVVACLFSKLNTLDEWRNIANTLNSSATTTIDEECSRILSLSYNHLPYNLKACFLYLGVFPEDEEIKASELVGLWAAEGLIKASDDESFDAVGERHIRELMDRNLIIASERSRCGRKMKTFMMHDLLHAFCVSEAHKENLLLVVRESNGFNLPQKCVRWVSIQLKGFDVLSLYSSLERCRSILWFGHWLHLNLDCFSVLRVIYYANDFGSMIIEDVTHLRFLWHENISVYFFKLADAWNLQTIKMKMAKALKSLEFPQLQYFHCEYFMFSQISSCSPKFLHPYLQKISWLRPEHCTEELFSSIPWLKAVEVRGRRKDFFNDFFQNLAYLQQLESLSIRVLYENSQTAQIDNNIVLLQNLKELVLIGTIFEWKEINVLCKLTRLEVLELSYDAYVGEEWELPENEKFCQLIFLKIHSCGFKHWKVNDDNFPKLERLELDSCRKLEKIPIDFAYFSILKSIKLTDCLPSTVASAKQIEEEKREYGNEDFFVIEQNRLEVSSSEYYGCFSQT